MSIAGFFTISLIAMLVIAITSLITYEILRVVWVLLPRVNVAPRIRVLLLIIPIFSAHIINIWIFAVAYFLVENFLDFGVLTGDKNLVGFSYENFVECLYFSATTYTSLGIGDVTPTNDLHMLASAEVLSGLVMIGWTLSFTYLTMEKFWSLHQRSHDKDEHKKIHIE